MKYCGIDLASKTSAICVMNSDRHIELETEAPTDEDGFRQALRDQQELVCVIEASPLAEWISRVLEGLGHQVIIIDPRKAKAVIATKRKTDKLDARNLARMAGTGWYSEVHRKSEDARLLRSYLKARTALVDTQRQQSNRIRGLLRAHGIRVGQVAQGRFVERVHHCLRDCPALLPAIQPLLDSWVSLRQDVAKLTKHLKKLARQDATCSLLMTVPGVGPLVATTYVATIDDPGRFSRSDQIAAYAGLVPSVYQSGDVDQRGRITKEGDRLLRYLLVEASHVLLNITHGTCALKRWGKRLEKRKGAAKAKVAVARKLAMILHRMWLTGTPFQASGVA